MLIAAYDTIEGTWCSVWLGLGTGKLFRTATVIDFASYWQFPFSQMLFCCSWSALIAICQRLANWPAH